MYERRERSRTLYSSASRKGSRSPASTSTIALTFVISTFCLNFTSLRILAEQTVRGRGASGLVAVFGVGALIGALFSAHLSRATIADLRCAGFALCELLIAPLRTPALISGLRPSSRRLSTTWNSSNSSSLIQLVSPDHLRGRLIGIYFFVFVGDWGDRSSGRNHVWLAHRCRWDGALVRRRRIRGSPRCTSGCVEERHAGERTAYRAAARRVTPRALTKSSRDLYGSHSGRQ